MVRRALGSEQRTATGRSPSQEEAPDCQLLLGMARPAPLSDRGEFISILTMQDKDGVCALRLADVRRADDGINDATVAAGAPTYIVLQKGFHGRTTQAARASDSSRAAYRSRPRSGWSRRWEKDSIGRPRSRSIRWKVSAIFGVNFRMRSSLSRKTVWTSVASSRCSTSLVSCCSSEIFC